MSRLAVYEKNRELKAAGKVVGFPVYNKFSRLSSYLPAIPKGKGVMITSYSGVGKTKIWKDLFMWTAIMLGEHVDNFNPKIILNLLEEEKDEFIDSFLCDYIYRVKRIIIDPLELNSFGPEALAEDKYRLVKECEEAAMTLMNKYVLIEDNVYHPTGLFYRCKNYSKEWGTHYWTTLKDPGEVIITGDDHGKLETQEGWKYSHYEPSDPDQHVFVVTDHLALLDTEASLNLRETMERWSFHYNRKQLQKNYNWTTVDIVQQTQGTEEQQFTFKGQSILSKVKPALSKIGERMYN